MATIAKQAIEIKTPDRGEYLTFKEAASQSFKRGELVTLSSGKVAALSGTDPGANTILGIALADASGTTDTDTVVFVPSPEAIFVLNLAASQTTALTQIGVAYESTEASDKVHVDTSATTIDVWVVVGLDPRDAVGDVAGRVYAKIVADRLQVTRNVSA